MSNFDDMSKAGYRKTINPIIYLNEEWKKISDYIPGLYPVYWVSNTGKVYSEQINALLKFDLVGKGYLKVTLQFYDGPRDMLVHRLVMLCFNPIPNASEYTVNHKDGDHTNNMLYNLEWATYSEQMEHASRANLLRSERYSEDEIRAICKQLESTSNQDEVIMNIYGNIKINNPEYYIKIKHLVNRIQRKLSWTNISDEYDITPKQAINPNQVISNEQVEALCSVLEQYGRDIPTRKAYSLIGIDIGKPDNQNYTRYMATMVNIRNRKTFDEITSKYNF